jgi:hypothetical protein
MKYTMHKPGRSAINGYDLPTPWAIRTPAPSRDRRIVLSEPLPVYEVFGVALYEGGQPDGCCKRCGMHKCACALATRKDAKAAPVQEAKTASDAPFAVGDLVRLVDVADGDYKKWHNRVGVVRDADVHAMRPLIEVRLGTETISAYASRFVRVAPDELPPGFVARTAYGAPYYDNEAACASVQPSRLADGGWQWFSIAHPTCIAKDVVRTMHEAMRLARGLERVEQLWESGHG